MAKKVPHLTVKGGRFYFRMRVPLPLVASLGTEVSKALGDVTKAQAEVMARELAAEHATSFLREKHRLGLVANAPAPAPASARPAASAEEAAAVSKWAARELLARDEAIRIEGMRSEVGDWWRSELLDLDDVLVAALSEGDMRGLWHDFKRDLAKHGLGFPETSAERRAAVHRWAMEQAKAIEGIRAREKGRPVETPAPLPPIEKQRRMRDALAAWKELARRPVKTEKAFARHVEVFEKMVGNPVLSTLRRADAVQFRDALQRWAVAEGKTARTADNILTSIKALANIAHDHGWMEGKPFDRLAITKGGKESEGREPWTPEELPKLFASDIFTAYKLPAKGDKAFRKAGRDAAYWVPLLVLYTGARPAEACQLWTDDLDEKAGGLVVEFRGSGERETRLKNPTSWRAVPIHSELIRLGLREYLADVREAAGGKPGPLFPHLPVIGENGPAGQFGTWFGEYKRRQGFPSALKSLHSFRHTVETELAFAGATPTLVDAIVGHEGQGIGRKVYAATIRRDSERLRETVELLKFGTLKLERVYQPR